MQRASAGIPYIENQALLETFTHAFQILLWMQREIEGSTVQRQKAFSLTEQCSPQFQYISSAVSLNNIGFIILYNFLSLAPQPFGPSSVILLYLSLSPSAFSLFLSAYFIFYYFFPFSVSPFSSSNFLL